MQVNGAALRAIVERSGISWTQYAELVGKDRTYIAHVVAGRRQVPWATAKAMADALVVPVAAILSSPNEKAS